MTIGFTQLAIQSKYAILRLESWPRFERCP